MVPRYLACYVMFGLVIVLSGIAFLVWQHAVSMLVGLLDTEDTAKPFIYAVSMLAVIFALFAVVMIAEPYLRTGARRGQLARRAARIAGSLVLAIALGLLVQEVIYHLPA
jgi:type VI protein secretion system component VasK